MDINRNNYETSFLLYLDRELSPAEMVRVEKFLSENPDLQKEFVLLQQTIFLPEDIKYDQKELLFHKEEKRRIIPLYWIRIAASVIILMTAGWLISTKILNHKEEIAVRNSVKIATVTVKQDQASKEIKNNDQADRFVKKDLALNKGQANQNREKEIAKKTAQVNQGVVKSLPQKNNTYAPQGDSLMAIKKSNAAGEIQPDGIQTGTNPKQISAVPGVRTAALVLVTAGSKDQIKDENTDLKEQNIQTDNAISVVALDDQNKSIKGFFKKLTGHNPGDDKTNNARTVHVSVFQFSY